MSASAIQLLQQLISTPSFSGEENDTALLIQKYLEEQNISSQRTHNNIWAVNKYFDTKKPSILLNSHHDTVRPNKAYERDPFDASIENGQLFGLGSNDAGGPLVSLIDTFKYFYEEERLKYNLVLAATAEEENSGDKGIRSILDVIPPVQFAIVGEPTEMKMAIAEKGLLVLDASAKGIPGHVAHTNNLNPIEIASADIQHLAQMKFEKVSELLGAVKISCSQINAGQSHNVVPASCEFVLDVRINEFYSNREIFDLLQKETKADLTARSFRLNSSSIPVDHLLVRAGIETGLEYYGSPTLSDQANLNCPSLKLGPGSSLRSHQADEFIYLSEIEEGNKIYVELLNRILK